MPIDLIIMTSILVLYFGSAWIAAGTDRRDPEFKGPAFPVGCVLGGVVFFLAGTYGFILGTIQAFNEKEPALAIAVIMLLLVACMGATLIIFPVKQYISDKRIIGANNYVEAEVVDILRIGRRKNHRYVIVCEYEGREYRSRQVSTYHSKIDTGTTVRVHGVKSSCPLVELPR